MPLEIEFELDFDQSKQSSLKLCSHWILRVARDDHRASLQKPLFKR